MSIGVHIHMETKVCRWEGMCACDIVVGGVGGDGGGEGDFDDQERFHLLDFDQSCHRTHDTIRSLQHLSSIPTNLYDHSSFLLIYIER